jgi:hypothetical protein
MTSHVDLAEARENHESILEIIDRMVENSRGYTSNLGGLMKRSFELAACARALGLPAHAHLRLGVEAGLAIFTCAQAPGRDATFTLAGQQVTSLGRVDESTAHTGRWTQTFYGACILGDADLIGAICAVPEALPTGSSTRGPGYTGLWFRILRTLGATGGIDGDLVVRALEATDPDVLPADVRDHALLVSVPALEVVYRVALADGAGLATALAGALAKHRAYWTEHAEYKNDPDGYVSWPLSALVAIARQRGLAVDVASPYLVPSVPA